MSSTLLGPGYAHTGHWVVVVTSPGLRNEIPPRPSLARVSAPPPRPCVPSTAPATPHTTTPTPGHATPTSAQNPRETPWRH